ncbi:MAG: hypothetical protein B7Y02_00665 [Rhodobacterales bacterium 17-64-5]|nr:MAG: hypothetical protein B7Y02_00665 [Rhodobacterales bacterium 17-64-5]
MSNRIDRPDLATAVTCLVLICSATPSAAQDPKLAWGYNSFGVPGLIDMPAAFSREDAELGFNVSHFKNQTRNTLTFQVSDRLSASFRYAMLYDVRETPDASVTNRHFDRSFSLHYRFMDEGRYRPAMAIGINDLVGTGIYGGEYIVASKTLTPRFRASLGLGWGRLGSYGGFTNPLAVLGAGFKTRPDYNNGLGGTFETKAWFHGDAAFFGGVEWQVSDKWRLTAEYSSDSYALEDGSAFDRKSPFNFGFSYQYSDNASLSARYLYGSEIGLQFSYTLNPKHPRLGSGSDTAPPPIVRRSANGQGDDLSIEGTGLAQDTARALTREGLDLDGLKLTGNVLQIQIRNGRYSIATQAIGRAARVLTRVAPSEVDTFVIRIATEGMPVTAVTLRRTDLEDLEFHPVAPDLLRANTRIADARDTLPSIDGRYPILSYSLEPYLSPSFFDPDAPLRADVGIALKGSYEPLPGLIFSGVVHQKVAGTLDQATRPSTSVLPRVRSEGSLYQKNDVPTIPELTMAYYFRPGADLFGRVTIGYLESMFGGVSTELLWKPQNSRLALGAEVNYVKQRDFDQLFGFRPYTVMTGHLSAYYDIGHGYHGELDVGRYLAGDTGATISLSREFDNGWRIGAFATFTNVSATDFGEGSFDKGIQLTIPVDWVLGRPNRTRYDTVIRPVQRDGGARLSVSGRLYDTVRGLQATQLDSTWGRFWR